MRVESNFFFVSIKEVINLPTYKLIDTFRKIIYLFYNPNINI